MTATTQRATGAPGTPDEQPGPSIPLRSIGTAATAIALAVATAIVGLMYLWPPIPSDHINYLDAARDFPVDPGPNAPQHQFMRIGLTLPMRLAMEVFGYSQATYHVVPLIATIVLVLAVFALGSMQFSRTVGLAAAVLTVGNSLIFVDISSPLPDLVSTAQFCAALTVAVAVRQGRALVTATRWRQTGALVAIGLLLGWSYLTREYIVFVWPLVPLVLVRWAGIRRTAALAARRWSVVAAPMLAIAAGEALLNAAVYGDALARWTVSSGHGELLDEQTYAADYQGHLRRWYLSRLWVVLAETPEGAWLTAAVVVLGVGALVPVRTRTARALRFLLLWALLVYVPLTLLGGVLDPEQPMLRLIKERYWYPILPAILLGATATVWLAVRAAIRLIPPFRAAAGLIAGAALLGVTAVPVATAHEQRLNDISYRVNGATQMEQLRTWLRANRDEVRVVRSDRRTVRVISIFANEPVGQTAWDGEVIGWYPEAPPEPGDYVVFYSVDSPVCYLCNNEIHRLFEGETPTAPDEWPKVFSTDDGVIEVYRVT